MKTRGIHSVDYLDFYLDAAQHLCLWRDYVRQLKHRVATNPPDDEKAVTRTLTLDSIVSRQFTDESHDADGQLSAFLRGNTADSKLWAETFGGPTAQPCPPSLPTTNQLTADESNDAQISRGDIQASALKILYTYFLPSAEREIMLPQQILNAVTTAVERDGRDDPDIFDSARAYVFEAMEKDAYPAFMRRRRAVVSSLRYGNVRSLRSALVKRGVKPGKPSYDHKPPQVLLGALPEE